MVVMALMLTVLVQVLAVFVLALAAVLGDELGGGGLCPKHVVAPQARCDAT